MSSAGLPAGRKASQAWRGVALPERALLLNRAVDHFVASGPAIAEEITRQMGRPIGQSPGEVRGFAERARHMIAIAPEALGDVDVGEKQSFTRFIRREPLGVVFVIAPWNYP